MDTVTTKEMLSAIEAWCQQLLAARAQRVPDAVHDCPKCHRPLNEGNSPNSDECTETDDDEGVCEAYAKLAACASIAEAGWLSTVAAIEMLQNYSILDHDARTLEQSIIAAWKDIV